MNKWIYIPALLALAALPLAAGAASTPAPAAATVPSQADLEKQLEDARARLNEDARRVAALSMQVNGGMMRNMALMRERMEKMSHRGFLGVDLDDDDAKSGGAVLAGVTPGGPADKAGLRAGDVITSINGTAIKAASDDSAADKLVEYLRDNAKPGDSLKVGYSRDGKDATTTVVPGSLRDFGIMIPPMPPVPPVPPVPAMPAMPPMPPMPAFNFIFGNNRVWGDMQLVALNPGLGQYFGTDKGLLVLHAAKSSPLQLQDGDVIQQIGGRDPVNPPHAMRILSSYGAGESVKLDIMRKGKPLTLNVTMPKDRDSDSSQTFNVRIRNPVVVGGDDDDDDGAGSR